MAFKKGRVAWNKGKKGLQVAWNKGLNKLANEKIKKTKTKDGLEVEAEFKTQNTENLSNQRVKISSEPIQTQEENVNTPEFQDMPEPEVMQPYVDPALDQAYFDFADSFHQLLYIRLIPTQATDKQLGALNRAGVTILKKLDKDQYIQKYGDVLTYLMVTTEILTTFAIYRRHQKRQEDAAKEKKSPEGIQSAKKEPNKEVSKQINLYETGGTQ